MSGGHAGGSVTDCAECWEMAYEPSWYAVMIAGDPFIQLPAEPGGQAIVRVRDRAPHDGSGHATHNPVASWRLRRHPADQQS